MGETSYRFHPAVPCYAVLYPKLVEIARKHGYAIAVHGSMSRDFDLVAIPWIDDAREPYPMILEMKEAVQGCIHHPDFDHLCVDGQPGIMPHGRKAWSIHLTSEGCRGPYLDVSVMPRIPLEATQPDPLI